MKKVFSILTTVLLIGGAAFGQAKLSGVVHDGEGKVLYLHKLDQNKPILIDSVKVGSKDTYSLTIPSNEIAFYRFGPSQQDFSLLVITPKTKKISVKSNYANFAKTFDVTSGGVDTKLARDFLNDGRIYIAKRDSLTQLYKSPTGDKNALGGQINNLSMRFIDRRNAFIKEAENSPSVLIATQYVNPEDEFEPFKMIVTSVQKIMPNSFYANALSQQLNSMIVPGAQAPEIALSDPSGVVRKLSDLKGKVVLIDFWASWCGPCRRENPNVVKLYEKYKAAGFDIYSVSLDRAAPNWQKAIAVDKLAWPNHVSELNGWKSTPGKAYGVKSVPHTVLIDKEGKVIATKIRGPQLEAKLAEIFEF